MAHYKRKKFLVDYDVQGALAARTAFYWFGCTVMTIGVAALLKLVSGRTGLQTPYADLWGLCRPIAIASLVLLPVIVYDMVQLSNRLAGPIMRLRRAMRQLAQGEPVETLSFRDDDFWREMAGEFNALAAELQERRKQASTASDLDRTQEILLTLGADAARETEPALV
ncbi:MAG TPA: hypothetical protein VMV10_21260 [Pirellulales bacterium]|nr:hypothetical protein [Pirellulales bacterium]